MTNKQRFERFEDALLHALLCAICGVIYESMTSNNPN